MPLLGEVKRVFAEVKQCFAQVQSVLVAMLFEEKREGSQKENATSCILRMEIAIILVDSK